RQQVLMFLAIAELLDQRGGNFLRAIPSLLSKTRGGEAAQRDREPAGPPAIQRRDSRRELQQVVEGGEATIAGIGVRAEVRLIKPPVGVREQLTKNGLTKAVCRQRCS